MRFFLGFTQIKKAYDELVAPKSGGPDGYMFDVQPFDPPVPDESFVRCRQEVSDLKSVVRVLAVHIEDLIEERRELRKRVQKYEGVPEI